MAARVIGAVLLAIGTAGEIWAIRLLKRPIMFRLTAERVALRLLQTILFELFVTPIARNPATSMAIFGATTIAGAVISAEGWLGSGGATKAGIALILGFFAAFPVFVLWLDWKRRELVRYAASTKIGVGISTWKTFDNRHPLRIAIEAYLRHTGASTLMIPDICDRAIYVQRGQELITYALFTRKRPRQCWLIAVHRGETPGSPWNPDSASVRPVSEKDLLAMINPRPSHK